MVTTVVIGMLCVHLLCFSLMFLLISSELHGKKMGMDVFALGNLMLGLAYVLQLFGGHANGSVMSIVNHTLTLCAPSDLCPGRPAFLRLPDPHLAPPACHRGGLHRRADPGAGAARDRSTPCLAGGFVRGALPGDDGCPRLCRNDPGQGPARRDGRFCRADRRHLRTQRGKVADDSLGRPAGA